MDTYKEFLQIFLVSVTCLFNSPHLLCHILLIFSISVSQKAEDFTTLSIILENGKN